MIYLRGLFLFCLIQLSIAEDLSKLLSTMPPPVGSECSFSFTDEEGKTLWSYNEDKMLSIASVTKLFTSVAAIKELGEDYKFHTKIYVTNLTSDGFCENLIVVGGADPCLDEHFTNKKPNSIFTNWAKTMKQQGIKKITGDIIIDNSIFSGKCKPDTYPEGYKNKTAWYSAPSSAFAWNDNCIEIRVSPSSQINRPAIVELRPFSSKIKIINKSKTVSYLKKHLITVAREENSNTIIVSGKYAKTTSWYPISIHNSPDLINGDHFKYLLQKSGIKVWGSTKIGLLPEKTDCKLIIDNTSNLSDAIEILNTRSQNFYGEQIFRLLGYKKHGTGSVKTGKQAISSILQGIGDFQILDGSGLSYGNKASSKSITSLLNSLTDKKLLYQSMKDYKIGKKNLKVKTGTLNIAKCLAGYYKTKKGKTISFALIMNRGKKARSDWKYQAKSYQKKLLEKLFKKF